MEAEATPHSIGNSLLIPYVLRSNYDILNLCSELTKMKMQLDLDA